MSIRAVAKRLYSSAREVPTKRYEYIYGVAPLTKEFEKIREDQDFFAEREEVYDRRPYDRPMNRLNYVYFTVIFLAWVPYVFYGKITKKLQKK